MLGSAIAFSRRAARSSSEMSPLLICARAHRLTSSQTFTAWWLTTDLRLEGRLPI